MPALSLNHKTMLTAPLGMDGFRSQGKSTSLPSSAQICFTGTAKQRGTIIRQMHKFSRLRSLGLFPMLTRKFIQTRESYSAISSGGKMESQKYPELRFRSSGASRESFSEWALMWPDVKSRGSLCANLFPSRLAQARATFRCTDSPQTRRHYTYIHYFIFIYIEWKWALELS